MVAKAAKVDAIVYNQTVDFLISRMALQRQSTGDPCGRNLDKECGYPDTPLSATQYYELYEKEGIAARVVGVHPDECWSVYPELYETEGKTYTSFEKAWLDLTHSSGLNPWHYLHRVDVLSGIGQYGLLLLGIDDGKSLDQPLAGADLPKDQVSPEKRELLYLRAFSENCVEVAEYETDWRSPRNGQPKMYEITVYQPSASGVGSPEPLSGSTSSSTKMRVHWTRTIHVADNRGSSEVFGMPRMRQPLHRIFDIRKVLGGSSEMFWKGAFPGYSFETFPELTSEAEIDHASVKRQIDAYQKGLQRYLTLVGMSAKSLAPQVADPTKHFDTLIAALCATIKVPVRIFLGSESGHLASTQDSVAWNRRLGHRQSTYLTPMLIYPFVRRLQKVGVLPWVKDITVAWKDLNSMSDKDKSDVSMKVTQALLQYVTSGAEKIMPLWHFLTLVLKFSDQEATKVVELAKNQKASDLLTKELWEQEEPGNTPGTKGGDPAKKTGVGGKRNGRSKK